MEQEAIVYHGKLEKYTYPCVVMNEDLLVKPLYIYIGDIEKSLLTGRIPISKPVIIGSTGVGRILESKTSNSEFAGKIVTISPFGKNGVLGVDRNGLLANYVSIDVSHVEDFTPTPKPLDSLKPLLKHAVELAKKAIEPVLVEGCGLIALLAGLVLDDLGLKPLFYCESNTRRISQFGFNVEKHLANVVKKWGSIIITSTEPSPKYKVLINTEYKRVIISKLSFTNWLPLTGRPSEIHAFLVERGDSVEPTVIRSLADKLNRFIKVLDIERIDDALGLMPPQRLGYILSIKN
ncbi:MAG: hypothetical protein QXE81_05910 [Desulfurococcaceae archaeon]